MRLRNFPNSNVAVCTFVYNTHRPKHANTLIYKVLEGPIIIHRRSQTMTTGRRYAARKIPRPCRILLEEIKIYYGKKLASCFRCDYIMGGLQFPCARVTGSPICPQQAEESLRNKQLPFQAVFIKKPALPLILCSQNTLV